MLLVDLETDEQFQLPFRQGFSRFSDDLALMAVDWSFVDDVPGKIEIWDTDTWENIYTFQTPYTLRAGADFAFSPDIPLHKVFNYIPYQRHTGCQWYRLPIDLDRKDRATGCFQRPPSLETTESSSSIHHGMYIFRRCAWC